MKKTKLTLITLAVVFLAVSIGFAQMPAPREAKKCPEGSKGQIFEGLNLTPEQQQKLSDNRKAQSQEMTQLLSGIREKQAKLQEALKDPKVSRATVEPIVKEIKTLQAKLIDQRVNGIFAVKQILTPEQFASFQQMAEKRNEAKKERLQKWLEKRKGSSKPCPAKTQ